MSFKAVMQIKTNAGIILLILKLLFNNNKYRKIIEKQ